MEGSVDQLKSRLFLVLNIYAFFKSYFLKLTNFEINY